VDGMDMRCWFWRELDCIEKRRGGDCNADGWHAIGNGIIMLFDRETERQYDNVPCNTSRFYACAWSRGICTL